MSLKESGLEQKFIDKLEDLKYIYRPDIRDKAALEQNFRQKFEALNHVRLTDAEFARLRDEIINADVFQAAKTLREYGWDRALAGVTSIEEVLRVTQAVEDAEEEPKENF